MIWYTELRAMKTVGQARLELIAVKQTYPLWPMQWAPLGSMGRKAGAPTDALPAPAPRKCEQCMGGPP